MVGEALLTLGVLIFLFAFYEAYYTNIASGRLQSDADRTLQQTWDNNPRGTLTPELGEAFARIYIPAFGTDFQFAIVEGTAEEDLLAGPGHYVDSQMSGDAGNFAVAGHRVGKGAPFNDLGNLEACDAIVIETQDTWDVYRVLPIDPASEDEARDVAKGCLSTSQAERIATGDYQGISGRSITTPDDISTIGALPGEPSNEATSNMEALVTLTTCHPQFSNAERMIVHGMLEESIAKQDGQRPEVLEET
ncbi:MAG: class E sortase [Corynebacterium sp.]|nr:class E sortase [Corynebacterium sp.]